MTIEFPNRRPSNAEILAYWKPGRRVQFRHFTREAVDSRTRNGVRHVKRSSATLRVSNEGRPFVRHHGRTEFLTASIAEHDGRSYLYDLRIDSPYLT